MFNFAQAVACAEANITLISPFVGRIYDWYKREQQCDFAPQDDPGVLSVSDIYAYYRKFDYKTIVMGASFRNTGEIEALAGCDRLTIGPALLDALQKDEGTLECALSAEGKSGGERIVENEAQFRFSNNEDAMATDKLSDGIRRFVADMVNLENFLASKKG